MKFEEILRNIYIANDNSQNESFACECKPGKDPQDACGEKSNCLNRSTAMECHPRRCPCGNACLNQRFQKCEYKKLEAFKTKNKGQGVRSIEYIKKDEFIIEYVGEVIDTLEYTLRSANYLEKGIQHFYFMTLKNDTLIDATKKGNISRLFNHSCNPNCATQKWIVNGRVCIGIFAIKNIPAFTELTFNYQCVRKSGSSQICRCGEPTCTGYIGEAPDEKFKRHKSKTKQIYIREKCTDFKRELPLKLGARKSTFLIPKAENARGFETSQYENASCHRILPISKEFVK